MQEQTLLAPQPFYSTRSTLLVPAAWYSNFFESGPRRKVRGVPLKQYLGRLMEDPQLHYKLGFLRSDKWKKQYQDGGQGLCRVDFYPDDLDWGRLSVISNSVGFSRCFIFVYLMLIDMGVIHLENGGTQSFFPEEQHNPVVKCVVTVNAFCRTLTRTLQT